MRRRFVIAAIAVALCSLEASPAWSVAQAGAVLLQYPIHVRTVSMGETGVADASDPSTIYYNPANVVAPGRAYVTASRMDWPDDWFAGDIWMGRANAGYSWHTGGGSLRWGADFTSGKFDYGESIVTDTSGNPLGTVHSLKKWRRSRWESDAPPENVSICPSALPASDGGPITRLEISPRTS